MPRDGWQSVALPDALYTKLEAKAKREKRSVSNMAQVIIEEAVKDG